MPSYAHALLALLSSSPITTANDRQIGDDAVHTAAATATSPHILQLEVNAPSRGAECAPSSHEKKWVGPKRDMPDVGVLSSNWEICHGSNEVCKADETSLLGGRCVARSRRMNGEEERFQACEDKCPGSKLCDYLYANKTATAQAIASACRNEDHLNCLSSYNATLFDVSYCSLYECYVGVEGYDGFKDMSEGDEGYSKIAQDVANCYYCVGAKDICMLCKENRSFSYCVKNEINADCEGAKLNQTYHYHPNCTDFGESQEGSSSSAGKSSLGSAAALALISTVIFNQE